MSISIIIPNYNGANLLKKNIPQVLKAVKSYQQESSNKVEIIIVDDCSTDSSVLEIENLKHDIKLLRNKKNLGFALSINNGVALAKEDIVVLLNSDVAPEKDFLVPLLVHFKDETIFAVGCMDKSIEGSRVILRGRGIGKWQRGFLVHSRGEVDKTNTLWVNGGSGAFRKSIWEKLGGFNSLYYPFYWEDIDISYRAQKAGYKVFFEPKSIVVHQHEEGAIKKKYSSFQIKTIAYKNQFIFVWINATDLDLQLKHILWLPYHFLMALKNFDWPFFRGFLLAIIKLPEIILYSFKVRKSFIKSDKEVIKNIKNYV